MELKDVILSTIAEMDDSANAISSSSEKSFDISEDRPVERSPFAQMTAVSKEIQSSQSSEGELKFLENVRERLLVLFEGFQSPNNANIEAKVDLTLNFLEYLLATIETRVDTLKSEK